MDTCLEQFINLFYVNQVVHINETHTVENFQNKCFGAVSEISVCCVYGCACMKAMSVSGKTLFCISSYFPHSSEFAHGGFFWWNFLQNPDWTICRNRGMDVGWAQYCLGLSCHFIAMLFIAAKKKNFLWISPLSDVSFYFCMPVFVKWIFQLFVWFVTFCRIHFERELWW